MELRRAPNNSSLWAGAWYGLLWCLRMLHWCVSVNTRPKHTGPWTGNTHGRVNLTIFCHLVCAHSPNIVLESYTQCEWLHPNDKRREIQEHYLFSEMILVVISFSVYWMFAVFSHWLMHLYKEELTEVLANYVGIWGAVPPYGLSHIEPTECCLYDSSKPRKTTWINNLYLHLLCGNPIHFNNC